MRDKLRQLGVPSEALIKKSTVVSSMPSGGNEDDKKNNHCDYCKEFLKPTFDFIKRYAKPTKAAPKPAAANKNNNSSGGSNNNKSGNTGGNNSSGNNGGFVDDGCGPTANKVNGTCVPINNTPTPKCVLADGRSDCNTCPVGVRTSQEDGRTYCITAPDPNADGAFCSANSALQSFDANGRSTGYQKVPGRMVGGVCMPTIQR